MKTTPVKSWLIDSMSPTLIPRFIRLKTAKEIWDAVAKTFYDGTDETQLFELNRRSFSTRQNGRTLASYYNELIGIFQEIDTRLMFHEDSVEHVVSLKQMSWPAPCAHYCGGALDPELFFNQQVGDDCIAAKDSSLDLVACYALCAIDNPAIPPWRNPKTSPIASLNREGLKTTCYEIVVTWSGGISPRKPRRKVGQEASQPQRKTKEQTPWQLTSESFNEYGMSNTTHSLNSEWIIDTGVAQVSQSMNLDTVLVVPSLSSNLLSIKKGSCYILKKRAAGEAYNVEGKKSPLWLWHRRLGHLSFSYLKKLKPELFLNKNNVEFNCDVCEMAKSHRSSYSPSENKVAVPFMKVHSDVWGPARISTPNGYRYFVTFIDECTRMVWVSLLKHKDEDLSVYFQENFTREYVNQEMKRFCEENSIRHQTSCANTPQQNGLAERRNKQILEIVRASLFDMKVPRQYWGEAVRTAAYVMNRTPSRVIDFKTPLQRLHETMELPTGPNLEPKVFGCTAFVHKDSGKLEPRAIRCMFLGYADFKKGYRCYDPKEKKMYITRDVKFHETVSFFDHDVFPQGEITTNLEGNVIHQNSEFSECLDDTGARVISDSDSNSDPTTRLLMVFQQNLLLERMVSHHQRSLKMQFRILLANNMALGYHAKAAPPTVTFPHLKSMGDLSGVEDYYWSATISNLKNAPEDSLEELQVTCSNEWSGSSLDMETEVDDASNVNWSTEPHGFDGMPDAE
ncbi:putative RNA-directed DNA polymerase [Tanacetum coccineum]